MMNGLSSYDVWKLAYPPEWDDPEPTEDHYKAALQVMLNRDYAMRTFIEGNDARLDEFKDMFHQDLEELARDIMDKDIEDAKDDADIAKWAATQDDY